MNKKETFNVICYPQVTGSFPCPPEWSLQTSLVVLCEEKKKKEKKQ